MRYSDARSLIRSGDVLAWTHRGWATWYDWQVQAVRVFTRSEFCHVGLAYRHHGRLFVLESVTPFVRMVPVSNLLGPEGLYWLRLNRQMSDIEEGFCFELVGKGRYSKLEAVKAALGAVRAGENDAWECAEYVGKARSLSDVNLGPTYTPTAIVDRCVTDYGSAIVKVTP